MATRNVAPPPEEPPAEPTPEPTPDAPSEMQAFKPQWRSALDDPAHPLHHLRDA